jgi:predicted RNase H-like HicB family nuclease
MKVIDIQQKESPAESLVWERPGPRVYECRAVLCPEAEGGYSVHALNLPGVVSQGETFREALANIAEAFRAAVSYYLETHGTIPWSPVDVERSQDSQERWILVNA